MNNKHIYVLTATAALKEYLLNNRRLAKPGFLDEQLKIKRGCFVSLHEPDDKLRGCIGTIEARFQTLFEEIVQNAISAATTDPRFSPVSPNELPNLKISVDVLTEPEKTTPGQLDPSIYGLIISDGFRKGILLPALEGVSTVNKQIDIVKRKAGLELTDNSELHFYRFKSKRYE